MKDFKNSMYTPNFSYTYPGKLNTDLIQKPYINTPSFSDLFTVIQGVRCGQYLNLMQPLTSVLTKGSATCAPTYTQSGSITDRKLDTGLFEINLSWCKKEFQAVCNVLGDSDLIGDGLSGYELGGRLRSAIFENVLNTANLDIWKLMFFSNNAVVSTSKWSAIDGVWTKFFDAFTAYCVQPISNALPNQHNSVLAPDQARDTFRLQWGNSNILLKQLPTNQKVFIVTGSMWENYYDSLINNCCVEGSWRMSQDGKTELFYRGIRVLPLWFADDSLSNDSTNPYYDVIRHFSIYTTPTNHMMGVESAADLNNLEMCYDCVTKTTYIQGEMRFGYQFAQCDLQSVAF